MIAVVVVVIVVVVIVVVVVVVVIVIVVVVVVGVVGFPPGYVFDVPRSWKTAPRTAKSKRTSEHRVP